MSASPIPQRGLPWLGVRGFLPGLVAAAHGFESHRSGDGLAVAHDLQMDGRTRILLSHHHLQSAGVGHFLAVDLGDDIADFQASLGARRIRFDLGHHRADGVVHVEELRVVRSDVGNSDSHVAVRHLAKLDQLLHRGTHDLRRNGESHAGERTRGRDQEGIDPDHFTARVHQRTAGVSRIDGRVGLNELARLAGVVGRRIRPVQRADNAARYREAKSERIAESQNGLSRDAASWSRPRARWAGRDPRS